MKASEFFTKEQKTSIEAAVKQAELETSGEIRVHIETDCKKDVLDRAAHIFSKLKMHKTVHRNGVLFYVAIKNKKFAVIGDVGIHKEVGSDFWDEIKHTMQLHFQKEEFTKGLIEGILMAAEKLKTHFPRQDNDINELPDQISFDK